jgi:hypothetical protein
MIILAVVVMRILPFQITDAGSMSSIYNQLTEEPVGLRINQEDTCLESNNFGQDTQSNFCITVWRRTTRVEWLDLAWRINLPGTGCEAC